MKDQLKQTALYCVYRKAKKKMKKFHPIKKIRKLIRKVKNRFRKYYYLKKRLPKIYGEYSKKEIENKVIFMELRVDELSPSFKYIYDQISKNTDCEIHTHYLRTGFVSHKERFHRAEEYIKDIANAKVIIVNEANDLLCNIKLREDSTYVQLWHGCGAFKKFGFSTVDQKFGSNRRTSNKYPMNTNYTFVTVSSPEVEWAYVEAMRLEETPEIVKPLGISRTDVFFDQEYLENAKEKLLEQIPQAEGKKVILYAPTFRGTVVGATAPDELDVAKFAEAFGDEYVLVIKHHPVVKKLPKIPEEYLGTFAFDVTHTMDINDLLCVSDICISDYSSLVFEYSLFERPMIFFAFDLDEYCDWRGFYYNYNDLTPGPVLTTNEEMIDYIKHIDTQFDQDEVHDFKEKFMKSCDGHATERILDLAFHR